MSIKIQDLTKVTTFIESTGTVLPGEHMPRVFFTESGWQFIPKPRWTVKRTNQREGNFSNYNGSDDTIGSVEMVLYGSNRKTDLQTLKDIKEPIYLDADDYDSNLSGNYKLKITSIDRIDRAELIDVKLSLEGYNN